MAISIDNNTELQLTKKRKSRVANTNSWLQVDVDIPLPYRIHQVVLLGGNPTNSPAIFLPRLIIRNLTTGVTRFSEDFGSGFYLSNVGVFKGEIITVEESLQVSGKLSATIEYFGRKVSDQEISKLKKYHKQQRQDEIAKEKAQKKQQKEVKK